MNGHARRRLDALRQDVELTELYDSLIAEVPPDQQQAHVTKMLFGLFLEHEEDHRKNRLGFRSLSNVVGGVVVGLLATLDRLVR